MKKKIFTIFSWTVIVTMMGIVLLITYWLLYPYKLVEFKQPVKLVNTTVKIEDNLLLIMNYCKFTTEIPIVTRHFIDGIIYDLPASQASSKVIGCGTAIVPVAIPRNLPPGKYVLQSVYTYNPNPIREINVSVSTEEFIVMK